MSYRFKAGRIYRMPTHFGPAPGPRQRRGRPEAYSTTSFRRGELPDRSRGAGTSDTSRPEYSNVIPASIHRLAPNLATMLA